MRFQVPQFIETETKLIGPLTLMQFLFVGAGLTMMALEFLILNGIIFLVAVFVTAAFFGALAFVKIDGQPFIKYIAYVLAYVLGSKQYVFRPKQSDQEFQLPGMPGNPKP